MSAYPRWSVLIPVHDCADYLAYTLVEVVAQLADRDDVQLLVVDDQSSDDPAAVVERSGLGRIGYAPNVDHLGAIGTFNRCLELATGEFVHLLHGDDAVLPGFYSVMEGVLDDHPDAVAALCRTRDTDAGNRPSYLSRSYRTGTGLWAGAAESMALSNRVRAPGIVVRRSAYQRLGGFRTDLPHAADWEMWTRLAANGPVVFVDEVLADYRKHAGSDTSARVRTGANVRERVTALGVVATHIDPRRRSAITRRGVVYAVIFAGRTAVSLARKGDRRSAGRQVMEAIRCLRWLPRGIPAG